MLFSVEISCVLSACCQSPRLAGAGATLSGNSSNTLSVLCSIPIVSALSERTSTPAWNELYTLALFTLFNYRQVHTTDSSREDNDIT